MDLICSKKSKRQRTRKTITFKWLCSKDVNVTASTPYMHPITTPTLQSIL